jgi:voltage-gated potassium channel
VDDVEEGLGLHDDGYRVAVGAYDDPETYRNIRADRAAMIFTGRNDTTNTNVAFTAREVTDRPTIVATVDHVDSIDVLELAGCDRVLHLGDLLGRAFARRILSPTARSKTIAGFEDLVIAETSAAGTELVGRTLMELGLRRRFGVTVVGLWERGSLEMATPELTVEETSILILAGTRDQIAAYDAAYTTDADGDGIPDEATAPVVIIGGGRVGRATAAALAESGIDYRIIERLGERIRDDDRYVHGDAADRDTLRRAGIDDTPAVVVTTHDDDTNLFLTLYCRKLRPEIEILGRVTRDRNLSTIHRAGADFVLSYASAGAIEVWNTIRADSTVLLAEGLVMFRTPTPRELTTRPLRETHVPRDDGLLRDRRRRRRRRREHAARPRRPAAGRQPDRADRHRGGRGALPAALRRTVRAFPARPVVGSSARPHLSTRRRLGGPPAPRRGYATRSTKAASCLRLRTSTMSST